MVAVGHEPHVEEHWNKPSFQSPGREEMSAVWVLQGHRPNKQELDSYLWSS